MKLLLSTLISILMLCSNLIAQNSVLTSGNWHKISTSTEGIYKISYSDLQSYGIDPTSIDPRNIQLFGNGGGMLAEANYAPKDEDLLEVAIKVIGETDGVFDVSDYILFYGQAPDQWEYDYSSQTYSHKKNLYSDNVFYFLTIGSNGKRIQLQSSSATQSNNISTNYDNLIFHELDNINLIQSGRMWLGEVFETQLSYTFNYNISNLNLSSDVTVNTSVAARSPINSEIEVNGDGNISTIPISIVSLTSYSGPYAKLGNGTMNFIPSSTTLPITFTYNQPDPLAIAWLDNFELITRNHLSKEGNQMIFRDKQSIGSGNITQFQLNNTLASDNIWEITTHNNVVEQNLNFTAGTSEFSLSTDSLREFIVFEINNLLTPTYNSIVANQNLHGLSSPEMVIVSHPNFISAANDLANFHLTNDGIICEVVTTEEIYNEFSSGSQDIVAINDFMEYLYHQPSSPLKYLLLFGDASYDYKDRIPNNTNFVPCYQTENSVDRVGSLTSDDYFGLLDSVEGTWNSIEIMDIAIGRLPVKTSQEASAIVNKIIEYKTNNTSFDDWRKTITFIGDDEDNNVHMSQANILAGMVDFNCSFTTERIFIDEYQQIGLGINQSYPEAEQKIVDAFRRGSLIINLTGHGGPDQFTHENIIDTNSLDTLNNSNYPLMITASSESSRYDNPSQVSFGEQFLLKPNAGTIASFSTTRLVFSSPNFQINISIYQKIFEKVNGKHKTLGEVFREVKNLNAATLNNRNFTLLGDPALTLNFPELSISATHPDTIQNNSVSIINGQIEDDNGLLQSWFNGDLIVFIQGDLDTINTLGNDGGNPFTFYERRDTVYYDTIIVSNGLFSYNIDLNMLPVHMTGNAKINYYAFNNTIDASGCNDEIYINDLLTNIDKVAMTTIKTIIYPNPSSSNVTISFKENGPYQFSLYSNIGQAVINSQAINETSFSFSVSELSNGIYHYRVTDQDSNSSSGKLVIQH
jgi:hypothetical protein